MTKLEYNSFHIFVIIFCVALVYDSRCRKCSFLNTVSLIKETALPASSEVSLLKETALYNISRCPVQFFS